jgi:hypothetical protein
MWLGAEQSRQAIRTVCSKTSGRIVFRQCILKCGAEGGAEDVNFGLGNR